MSKNQTINDALKALFLGLGGDSTKLADNQKISDYIDDLESALKKRIAPVPTESGYILKSSINPVGTKWVQDYALVRATGGVATIPSDVAKAISSNTSIRIGVSEVSSQTQYFSCYKSFKSGGTSFSPVYTYQFISVQRDTNSTVIRSFDVVGKDEQTATINTVTIPDPT